MNNEFKLITLNNLALFLENLKTIIDAKVSSLVVYKGAVDTYEDLPETDLEVGDTYRVNTASPEHGIEAGEWASWNGNEWSPMGGLVSLVDYYTKGEINNLFYTKSESLSTTQINNLFYTKTAVDSLLSNKQNSLVSGTNIKTINGESLLGEGNIDIEAGSSSLMYSAKTSSQGSATASAPNINILVDEETLPFLDVETGEESNSWEGTKHIFNAPDGNGYSKAIELGFVETQSNVVRDINLYYAKQAGKVESNFKAVSISTDLTNYGNSLYLKACNINGDFDDTKLYLNNYSLSYIISTLQGDNTRINTLNSQLSNINATLTSYGNTITAHTAAIAKCNTDIASIKNPEIYKTYEYTDSTYGTIYKHPRIETKAGNNTGTILYVDKNAMYLDYPYIGGANNNSNYNLIRVSNLLSTDYWGWMATMDASMIVGLHSIEVPQSQTAGKYDYLTCVLTGVGDTYKMPTLTNAIDYLHINPKPAAGVQTLIRWADLDGEVDPSNAAGITPANATVSIGATSLSNIEFCVEGEKIASVQDILDQIATKLDSSSFVFDSVPTAGSNKLLTSGTIKTALDSLTPSGNNSGWELDNSNNINSTISDDSKDDFINSSNNIVSGTNNTLNTATYNYIFGSDNDIIKATKSSIEGGGHTVKSDATKVVLTDDTLLYAHAEGSGNEIYNSGHVEGNMNNVKGLWAHAEGHSGYATGNYSHSEGSQSTAAGIASHAEGFTTEANASYSHAGGKGTIVHADAEAQTAIGEYNIVDTNNDYAFIVGNGTAQERSNAFAVPKTGGITLFDESTPINLNSDILTKLIESTDSIWSFTSDYNTGMINSDRVLGIGATITDVVIPNQNFRNSYYSLVDTEDVGGDTYIKGIQVAYDGVYELHTNISLSSSYTSGLGVGQVIKIDRDSSATEPAPSIEPRVFQLMGGTSSSNGGMESCYYLSLKAEDIIIPYWASSQVLSTQAGGPSIKISIRKIG